MSRVFFSRVAIGGAAACVLLLALRVHGSLSVAEPLQLITSGDEQSSLYALWKFLHSLPVYHDRFAIPFDAVMYNWFFYAFYGSFVRAGLAVASLGDEWIPTVGRLLSLAAVGAVAAGAYSVFRCALGEGRDGRRSIALAFAIYTGFGPLVGFWAITVRADPWAFAFDVLAVAAFLALYPRDRWRALAVFAVLAYLGWSCKQNSVISLGAVGLFLLFRRQWGLAAALGAASIAAWTATLILGSPQYLKNVLFVGYPFEYSIAHGLRNLGNFSVKMIPTLLLLTVVIVKLRHDVRTLWRDDLTLIAALGVAVGAVVSVPASFQTGAAENYYFVLSFYLTALALSLLGRLLSAGTAATAFFAGAAGWAGLIMAIGLVVIGVTGVIDNRAQHRSNMAVAECIARLPRPVFVNNSVLSLPWITRDAVPFVLSYTYLRERGESKAFESGGIGGLIDKGYFAALVLSGDRPPIEFDGGSLAGYRHDPETCSVPGVAIARRD